MLKLALIKNVSLLIKLLKTEWQVVITKMVAMQLEVFLFTLYKKIIVKGADILPWPFSVYTWPDSLKMCLREW